MRRSSLLLATVLLLWAGPAGADEPLLGNGDFSAWKDGMPVGWVAAEGARHGFQGPKSETNRFEPLEGGGVASVNTPTAGLWKMLTRRFAARPGEVFRLDFEARGVGLKKEQHQFANRWVGAFFKNAKGQRLAFPFVEVHTDAWQKGFLHVQAPRGTAYGEAAFFCSLTGRFEVRRMALSRVEPSDSFDVLVQDMDRYYPFFQQHDIDWKKLTAEHRKKALAAKTPAAFATAITPMLAALKDGHVWIDVPRKPRRPTWPPAAPTNFSLQEVMKRLASHRQVVRNVLVGRTKDGYGYLAIGSMQGKRPDLVLVDAAWRSLFDTPGIILDLRVNGGGQEMWGQHLLGALADVPVYYATSRLRSGPGHDEFHTGAKRYVQPRKERYRGPVIALVGPGCMSSGEAMAMMGRALTNVTLVGLPTRGSSGSPAPVALPNGVTVWYSRWISLFPDGTGFERRGVAPDVRVEHKAGTDTAFDKALELLKKRVSK
ncbi:MAG: S41 family peptidase [Planctomycetota bacterium]|nr:S41 family peptidase [Planctomycetota bacterium]